MTEFNSTRKISFPRIEGVRLYDFDLYSDQPQAEVKIEKPVFCLIGANGLGKTTFLNTLLFAITGAISNTSQKYQTDKKYLRDNSQPDKISDYFSGRISEDSRPTAGVEVKLVWNDCSILVARDLFNGSEIRELHISSNETGREVEPENGDSDLDSLYVSEVLRQTGLRDFSQFVFIVHFLWSFGEDRHLLLWDHTALTDALYLAFGGDPDNAKRAAKLRADIEKTESNARNRKYAAKQLTDSMKELSKVLEKAQPESEDEDEETSKSLRATYDQLISNVSDREERSILKRTELQDTDLKWAELSSAVSEAQIEYQRVFSEHFKNTSSVHHHPILKASISEQACAVCHSTSSISTIEQALESGKCPLCDAEIEAPDIDDGRDLLKSLDAKIAELRTETQTVLNTRTRLSSEYEASVAALQGAEDALAEFEAARPDFETPSGGDLSAEALSREIDELERKRNLLTEQSKKLYDKRDEIREDLRELEKSLKAEYDEGAASFVSRFRELAEEFVGIPIDIKLNEFHTQTKNGFSLSLLMGNEARLSSNAVSESQGFFIDIALRMSIAEFMSDTPATLLIDTPEGSLDIAYEARAGSMFSKFADAGNFILMTANLRSSELVSRLAKRQSSDRMAIVKMTEWSELSKVQKQEERLFEGAYTAIENALAGAD